MRADVVIVHTELSSETKVCAKVTELLGGALQTLSNSETAEAFPRWWASRCWNVVSKTPNAPAVKKGDAFKMIVARQLAAVRDCSDSDLMQWLRRGMRDMTDPGTMHKSFPAPAVGKPKSGEKKS